MTEFKPIKEGKVREIYDNGDSLIMVATDRISAFDYILKNKITNKGKVLTQMSKFWFDYTRDVVPNHLISVDNKDMPEYFQQPEFEGKCTMCRKLTMLLHHRQRLGQLPGERHCLRHQAARGPERVPEAAGAHLHPLHQGRAGRPR